MSTYKQYLCNILARIKRIDNPLRLLYALDCRKAAHRLTAGRGCSGLSAKRGRAPVNLLIRSLSLLGAPMPTDKIAQFDCKTIIIY